MNRIVSMFLALVLSLGSTAQAQTTPPSQTLAATLNVYAFPEEGQAPEQQSKDEAECYDWAVSSSGGDPFSLEKQSAEAKEAAAQQTEAAQQATQGAGAKGAVRGAAAGALIGEIADDDAGKGAAYGAAAGLVASRRGAHRQSQQTQQQIQQQSATQQEATAEQIENFKKAFSVCLEAKRYMVKY